MVLEFTEFERVLLDTPRPFLHRPDRKGDERREKHDARDEFFVHCLLLSTEKNFSF
jgi:hypothetical protein